MTRDINPWVDSASTRELRKQCLYLVKELDEWGIRPFYKERKKLDKTIRYSYNEKRLLYIHTKLQNTLDKAMMKKLSEGL